MTVPTQYEIDKALVSMAIEYTLLDFGKDVHDTVVKRLNDDDLSITDCFDHPKHFNRILNEQYRSSYTKIIHAIHIWLRNSSSNESISNFLAVALDENLTPLSYDQHLAKSAILLAIEKSLLKMGLPELKRVESKLLSDFNCTFEDCVRNPIPLKKVLFELFGNCYEDIYQSMTYSLKNSSIDESITKFLILMKE